MSQGIFNDINSSVTSGTELATLLNDFKDAVVSGFSGTSRPANLQAAGYWVDTTNDPTEWSMMFYDGTNDIELFKIDVQNGIASVSAGGDLLELIKISDDVIPPVLKFLKQRTGTGQTLVGDVLGQFEIYGTDSGGIERQQANVKVQTTDNTSVTNLGSYLALELAETGTGSLVELIRFIDNKVGINEINPDNTLHVKGDGIRAERLEASATASSVILEKKRVANNGQILVNDEISKVQTESHDQNGAKFEAANIKVSASQTHTDVARGTKLSISTINDGSTTLTEQLVIDSSGTTITTLNVTNLNTGDVTASKASDDTVSPKFITDKERVSGLGQVLQDDGIGKVEMHSTDVDGDDFEAAFIEGYALENHDNTNRGTKIEIATIAAGSTTLVTRINIDEVVNIPGDLTVDGNLTVSGTTTTVDTAVLDVTDANITVNKGGTQAVANSNVGGLTVEMSDATDARIGYDSTLTSKFKVGEVGSEAEIADVSSAQTFTNKTMTSPVLNTADINTPDIDGGTVTGSSIETPTRLDVKQDTEANLITYASTASNGQFVFATDTKRMYQIVDNALTAVGGGLGGGIDVYLAEDFEDTDAADFQTGNNASFLGGGSLAGTLSDVAGDDGDIIRFTQAAGSLNDYFSLPNETVGNVQQGKINTAIVHYTYDGNDDEIRIIPHDQTNGNDLTVSSYAVGRTGSTRRQEIKFFVPESCTSLAFGFQVDVLNSGAIFDLYRVELNTNPFNFTGIDKKQTYEITQAHNAMTNLVGEIEFNLGTATIADNGDRLIEAEDDSGNTRTKFNATQDCHVVVNFTGLTTASADTPDIYVNGVVVQEGNQAAAGVTRNSVSASLFLNAGDYLSFGASGNLTSSTILCYVTIQASAKSEYLVTNEIEGSNWTDYTPTTQGFGTVSAVNFRYKRYGDSVRVVGFLTCGTVSANEAQIGLPNSVAIDTNVDALSIIGTCWRGTTANNDNYSCLATAGDTFVNIGYQTTGVNNINSAQNGNALFASSDVIFVNFEVPVESWNLENSITVVSPLLKACRIYDQKSDGTAGGTGSANAWTARDLNQLDGDTSFVTLNANQFTLSKGEYIINATAPFKGSDSASLRLYNTTDTALQDNLLSGQVSTGANQNAIYVPLNGRFKIDSSKTFELQYLINQSVSTDDLGRARLGTVSEVEIYADILLQKVR